MNDLLAYGAGGLVAAGVAKWLSGLLSRPAERPPLLDTPLFFWHEANCCSLREYMPGIVCCGRSGGGKTTGFGRMIARSLLFLPHMGVESTILALMSKPEDLAMWLQFAEETLRENVRVFGPGHKLKLNYLGQLHKAGAHTREIVKALEVLGETRRSSNTKAGEKHHFYEQAQNLMLYHTALPCTLAEGTPNPNSFHRFIMERPQPGTFDSRETKAQYEKGFHWQTFLRAADAPKTAEQAKDLAMSGDYWHGLLAADERTLGNTLAGVNNILFTLCSGEVSTLLAGEDNFDLMEPGSLTLVNASPTVYGDSGYMISAALKMSAQQAVLRRAWDESEGIHMIFGDEAPNWITSVDSPYMAQARSHGGSMVYLFQSRSGAAEKLGGDHRAQVQIESLMANFPVKVAHALGDMETANWIASLCGQHYSTYIGGSMEPSQGVGNDLFGYGRYRGNFSRHLENYVRGDQLIHGLRTGGPENRFLVDALVCKSGMPFTSGLNYLFTSFSQR